MTAESIHSETGVDGLISQIQTDCVVQQFRPGERLGSERGLAERYGVSRSRLRRALDALEAAGHIRRGMGRTGGIFVDDARIQRHLNTTQGVPEMVRRQGMTLHTRVLRADAATAEPAECRNLGLPQRANVFHLERLRTVDGIPWSLDSSTLPAAKFPGFLGRDLSTSLYATLAGNYGCVIDHADETIEVVTASPAQAALLQISVGDPLLLIWRTATDEHGDTVEFAHDLFRADRTRVHMHKYGENWKRAGHTPSERSVSGTR